MNIKYCIRGKHKLTNTLRELSISTVLSKSNRGIFLAFKFNPTFHIQSSPSLILLHILRLQITFSFGTGCISSVPYRKGNSNSLKQSNSSVRKVVTRYLTNITFAEKVFQIFSYNQTVIRNVYQYHSCSQQAQASIEPLHMIDAISINLWDLGATLQLWSNHAIWIHPFDSWNFFNKPNTGCKKCLDLPIHRFIKSKRTNPFELAGIRRISYPHL